MILNFWPTVSFIHCFSITQLMIMIMIRMIITCIYICINSAKFLSLSIMLYNDFRDLSPNKYMLFAGWEVRIVKNCDRGAASGSIFKTEVTVFHYTDRPKLVNNLFIFFLSLKRLCLLREKTHASVTVTVVRDPGHSFSLYGPT